MERRGESRHSVRLSGGSALHNHAVDRHHRLVERDYLLRPVDVDEQLCRVGAGIPQAMLRVRRDLH